MMGREEAKDVERQLAANDDERRCILCEGVIEISEHEIFFATGRCRFCHQALESED
jgi:hypothetical protein